MRIGFKTSQSNVSWQALLDTWQHADEDLTAFDSGWLFDHFDHFVSVPGDRGGSHEAFVLATALAGSTHRLQLGHLVLGNTHRHPALVVKMATTLDHVSKGRFVLGLGAGWNLREHEMYGWPLPPIGARLQALGGAVRIMKRFWGTDGYFSVSDGPYELRDVRCEPKAYTAGGPPIWLGVQGPRGLRLVAESADGWNSFGTFPAFLEKREWLYRSCDALGRDPSSVITSVQVEYEGDMNALRHIGARYAREGVDHLILYIQGYDGPTLIDRLAREVAEPLRSMA